MFLRPAELARHAGQCDLFDGIHFTILYRPANGFGHFSADVHQILKRRKVERLSPVAGGVLGIGMHFEDQSVCASGNCGSRHAGYQG